MKIEKNINIQTTQNLWRFKPNRNRKYSCSLEGTIFTADSKDDVLDFIDSWWAKMPSRTGRTARSPYKRNDIELIVSEMQEIIILSEGGKEEAVIEYDIFKNKRVMRKK